MKIVSADVLVTHPGRNFVTLRVRTDDGLEGFGDATLNGRELSVKSYLEDHLVPCLIGRDPFRTEDIWQYFYRGAYWRRGPVTMVAISAIDCALWDIKGKALGVPVYQLLGGASRDRIRAYAHCSGHDPEAAIAEAHAAMDHGFTAVRLQCGIPGLAGVYGTGRTWFYETVDRSLPPEPTWDTGKYMRSLPSLFKEARNVLGDDVDLLHDVHHRLTPNEAARLARDIEPYRPFWLEDAVPGENQEAYEHLRRHTTVPLAVGEVFNSVHDCRTLIERGLIDHLRMAVSHGGGLTQMRRIAPFAEMHHVRMSPHGATDISPVGTAAALHFDLWAPNLGIQEYMEHPAETLEIFRPAYSVEGGWLHPGDEPGLGVSYDETLGGKTDYKRFYLPVNRLEDGTLWHW